MPDPAHLLADTVWLQPVFYAAAVVICFRNMTVSRNMPFTIVGFGLLLTNWLVVTACGWPQGRTSLYAGIWPYARLLSTWAWLVVVVGLAQVLRDSERSVVRRRRKNRRTKRVDVVRPAVEP